MPLRYSLYVILGLMVVFVVFLGMVFLARPTAQRFTEAGNGIALGPAHAHRPAITDVFARLGAAAVGAAAGSSADLLANPDPAEPTPQEQELLDLTNQARAEEGLPELAYDPLLLGVARARADAQIGTSALSHYDFLGELAFIGLLDAVGADFTFAGENLARAETSSPTVVSLLQEALMNSPTHRTNIMDAEFSSVAIGSSSDASGQVAFAQIFRAAPAGTAVGVPSQAP